MRTDKLRHLEHRDLALTAEDLLQLLIRQDIALIGRILEVILLDVYPKLFYHLSSRHRTFPDDRFEVGREIEGLR